jgi:PAS domain S-box-containing protein
MSQGDANPEGQINERRWAEEALRKSEELHRLTLSNVSDAVFITNDTGAFTYICPNAAVIFGYSSEEVQSLGNIDRVLGNDLFDKNELEASGEIRNIERAVADKAGTRHTLLVNVKRVSIDGGTTLYTCRDITDRKWAEEALRESEEHYRSVTETISDAIITIDEESAIVFANAAAEKLFGYPAAELRGGDLTMLMPDYLRHLHRAGVRRYVETGEKHMSWQGVELPGLHKNGQEIPLEISFSEFRRGGRRHFTGVARDITKRKQAEAKVQRLLEEVSKLYQLSRAIIGMVDPDIAMSSIAGQVKDVLGVEFCAIFAPEGGSVWRQLSPAACTRALSPFAPSPEIIQEVFLSGELKQIQGDGAAGALVELRSPVTYLPLKAGTKPLGVMVLVSSTLEDETVEAVAGLVAMALERARFLREMSRMEALKQSDKLKSALLASVSHDLRTPLTSIRTCVESLLHAEANWDKSALHEFHLIISEEVKRLTRLVENLLAMARIEAGELRLSKQWSSVAEICSNVLDRCAAATRHDRVNVECDEALPLVNVDARLIAEALANLVENAAKYSPPGSEITVRARLEGDELTFNVIDQGPGIALEEIGRIFDKFYRGMRPRGQQDSGTGMGLAIARGIIESHGGRIWAESTSGYGATFSFSLKVEHKDAPDPLSEG